MEIPISRLYDSTQMRLPVRVVRGGRKGPSAFITAAIHGDEINGVEITKRLFRHSALKSLRGSLIAVPIVNVFGFNNKSRYLPDRRDLNRSFPGSEHGSLASRLTHIVMREVVRRCDFGIDLHTGSLHRYNVPQVRAAFRSQRARRLAYEFGAPVILNAAAREGSLRHAAAALDIPVVVYEGGEALRFDELAIRSGVRGILRALRSMGMLDAQIPAASGRRSTVPDARVAVAAGSSHWIRAPQAGTLRPTKKLGSLVDTGEKLGVVSDPFGRYPIVVRAERRGIVIGALRLPLVNRGDALFHIAYFTSGRAARHSASAIEELLDTDYAAAF